ncbi:methionyl-tRNA formyltransferase-like protein [Trichlorobacter lovleyi]|uniref:Methionyl-tRNA formyltransferase-like protein n=1 Tax=Trichlorobacter lovleyi (strain ATCC BAA-1151 / DSM 17278 / SZ) TaxID=398767 RepID=B3EBQ7_TRIL1|nr:methionyl-tRNA formyltransferase-like protein [Trichlorobacter lovleyi]ACD97096.1 Methionyl-tRNA formyltransferase-like protein [Trichlorobacter lovleyi SZ]
MDNSFGMILFPGMRSLAYLAAFERAAVHPVRVVMLSHSILHFQDICAESMRYHYDTSYFDVTETAEKYCKRHGIPLDTVGANNINDDELLQYLDGFDLETWIFTGGGILRDKILSSGKRFIHVHPGRLPAYRGSTTFYYSLLEDGTLYGTAFFMGAELDDGPILEEAAFRVNIYLNQDQSHFVDAILDPYVRSMVLERLLRRWHCKLSPKPQKNISAPQCKPYFVMHPFLRLVAIKRLNDSYSKKLPEGIFVVEDPGE